MNIKLSKYDVLWSYIAQFFNIGSGLITLPLVLRMLSTEEIAMNYLMLTIGTMVALIDFGFAPQFGRNVSYVFSGAQSLTREGIKQENVTSVVNYHLLKCLIDVAKTVYKYMSLIVLFVMLTFGTLYIYAVTNGFNNVSNSLLIWIIYSVSTYFNIYFCYYISLLTGRGLIKESKIATLTSKISYIFISYVLILLGMGLLGLCISNLLSPFLSRAICYYYFYDDEMKKKLSLHHSSKKEKKELFSIISYNAKKLGINFVGSYAILKFSMFIVGLYLVTSDIASYGLMLQLVGIITVVSSTFFNSTLPSLVSYRVSNQLDELVSSFSMAMLVFYFIFFSLSIGLILWGPWLLAVIGSNATLPSLDILLWYLIVTFLENNHGNFATFITIENKVPFVKAALLSGFAICLGDILILQFTDLGLIGVVFVQGAVQLLYNNWYWPTYVLKEYHISGSSFICQGLNKSFSMAQNYFCKHL